MMLLLILLEQWFVLEKKRVRGSKSGMIVGKTSTYKKAIVQLPEGEAIDFYSNI